MVINVEWLYWLVVDLPSWKIWKSVGMMTFPIDGKIKNVWNHQPDIDNKWQQQVNSNEFKCVDGWE